MSTEHPVLPGPDDDVSRTSAGRRSHVESEHVDVGQATIDVSAATIVQPPASRQTALYLAYSVVVLFLFVIAGLVTSLLFTSSQVHAVRSQNARIEQNAVGLARASAVLRKQIRADCGFDRDLAGLPLANTSTGHPSELGVKIISDSRGAWAGHGCPGRLPPPDPSYVAGAKFYKLPVN